MPFGMSSGMNKRKPQKKMKGIHRTNFELGVAKSQIAYNTMRAIAAALGMPWQFTVHAARTNSPLVVCRCAETPLGDTSLHKLPSAAIHPLFMRFAWDFLLGDSPPEKEI